MGLNMELEVGKGRPIKNLSPGVKIPFPFLFLVRIIVPHRLVMQPGKIGDHKIPYLLLFYYFSF